MYMVIRISCDGNYANLMTKERLLKILNDCDYGEYIEFRDLIDIIEDDKDRGDREEIDIGLDRGPERLIVMKGEIVTPKPVKVIEEWHLD